MLQFVIISLFKYYTLCSISNHNIEIATVDALRPLATVETNIKNTTAYNEKKKIIKMWVSSVIKNEKKLNEQYKTRKNRELSKKFYLDSCEELGITEEDSKMISFFLSQ